jgi:hypothetical protein
MAAQPEREAIAAMKMKLRMGFPSSVIPDFDPGPAFL